MCDHEENRRHCGEHRAAACGCQDSRVERFIEPCLLLLLLEKPAHGYDVISRLKGFGFGDQQDPGVVYRNLRRLEDQGLITSEWDTSGTGPAKRRYQVTPEGREMLKAWAEAIRLNVANLRAFLERLERVSP